MAVIMSSFMSKMFQLSSTTFRLRCYQPKTMVLRGFKTPERPKTSKGKEPQINLEQKSMGAKQNNITLSDQTQTNLSKGKVDNIDHAASNTENLSSSK